MNVRAHLLQHIAARCALHGSTATLLAVRGLLTNSTLGATVREVRPPAKKFCADTSTYVAELIRASSHARIKALATASTRISYPPHQHQAASLPSSPIWTAVQRQRLQAGLRTTAITHEPLHQMESRQQATQTKVQHTSQLSTTCCPTSLPQVLHQ